MSSPAACDNWMLLITEFVLGFKKFSVTIPLEISITLVPGAYKDHIFRTHCRSRLDSHSNRLLITMADALMMVTARRTSLHLQLRSPSESGENIEKRQTYTAWRIIGKLTDLTLSTGNLDSQDQLKCHNCFFSILFFFSFWILPPKYPCYGVNFILPIHVEVLIPST